MEQLPRLTGEKECPRCHAAFTWPDDDETTEPDIYNILWVGMCETCMRDFGGCCSTAAYSRQHGIRTQHDPTTHVWNQPVESFAEDFAEDEEQPRLRLVREDTGEALSDQGEPPPEAPQPSS